MESYLWWCNNIASDFVKDNTILQQFFFEPEISSLTVTFIDLL